MSFHISIRRLRFLLGNRGHDVLQLIRGSLGSQRNGTVGINKRSIHGYEVAKEFEHLVMSATQKPTSISSIQNVEKPMQYQL